MVSKYNLYNVLFLLFYKFYSTQAQLRCVSATPHERFSVVLSVVLSNRCVCVCVLCMCLFVLRVCDDVVEVQLRGLKVPLKVLLNAFVNFVFSEREGGK